MSTQGGALRSGRHKPDGIPGLPTWVAGPGTRLLADGRLAALAFALLCAVCIAWRLEQTINNDISWYLISAGALLDGGRLYDDIFFEVNPPLMLYLTVPPVWLARHLGVFAVPVYYLYVFALAGLSLSMVWRVLAKLPDVPLPLRRGFLLAALLTLAVLPAGDFGQREHMMMILALPYILLAAVRAEDGTCGRPLSAAVGIAAALGFAIKPHFLLMPCAIELYLLVRRRRLTGILRAETVALGTTGALYGVAVVLFTPDYFSTVVPYALDVYNSAYRNELVFVLRRKEAVLLPLVLLLYLIRRKDQGLKAVSDLFLLAALSTFAAYLVQMKGWNYHIYPTTALLLLALAWMLAGAIGVGPGQKSQSRGRGRGRAQTEIPRTGAPPLLVLAAIAVLLVHPVTKPGNRYRVMERMAPHMDALPEGTPVYFFTSNTWTSFPMVLYARAKWSSRFPALWLLPGLELIREEAAASDRAEEIERFVTDAVIADLSAQPPALIFVDVRRNKPWYREDIDFIQFFSRDPRFERFWARYEKIDDLPGYEVYRPVR